MATTTSSAAAPSPAPLPQSPSHEKRTFSLTSIRESEAVRDFSDLRSQAPSRGSRRNSGSTYNGRPSSIDQSRRPRSIRTSIDQPYIGTFRFEDEAEMSAQHEAAKDKDLENGDSSSQDVDVEKQKPSAGKHDDKDPNVVDWNGPDDPENPQNWSHPWKWFLTATTGILTFAITFASSIFSSASSQAAEEFGVSQEVMLLGTALFVVGFAWGPIIWGPFSELYGRKIPLFTGYLIFAIFQIPVAVAPNLQTIFICRFFGGFFGSSPLAIVGGFLADLWDPATRGIAMSIFSGATFIGPVAGPIVGSFVTQSYLGWRWTEWITAILGFAIWIALVFVVPETYAPLLLSRRARKLKFETKNWALRAPMDEKQVDVKDIAVRYLARPFAMLLEPILLLITIYMSLIYGILYLFFESYPISFEEQRGLSPGLASLPFLAIIVGVMFGVALITYTTLTRFKPIMEREGAVVPEERLIPMIIGGVFLPVGLFWFAWTSNPAINLWPQVLSGIFIGLGVMVIFLQGLNYILDCYKMYGNSAIAANTFVRSWVGGGFVMFATPMYGNLGVPWATSLLAFLCVALFPAPILFYIYGAKIRTWSRYAPT